MAPPILYTRYYGKTYSVVDPEPVGSDKLPSTMTKIAWNLLNTQWLLSILLLGQKIHRKAPQISSLKLKFVLQFCCKILLLPAKSVIRSDPDPKFPKKVGSGSRLGSEKNYFGSTTLVYKDKIKRI